MITVIKEMPKLLNKILPVFADASCTDYKLSPYIICKKNDSGLLVFTTLSCSLLFLENAFSTADILQAAKEDENTRKTLLLHRVIIPRNTDEQTFCEKIRSILFTQKKRQLHGRFDGYTIFTTTACNARCYYCFEHGYTPVTMTDETARKTAEFIKEHAAKTVTLTWFGGEPLVNTKAIDIITDYLTENGVSFVSHIVTNGYLFTPELIKKAKEKYHLVQAQITLDGTRENYNRIKNYINGDEDAYTRVMGNIKNLADMGITVAISILLSKANEQDLYALLNELLPIAKEKNNRVIISPSLLQQYGGSAQEDEMQKKLIQMKNYLRESEYGYAPSLPHTLVINHCTADNPGKVIIEPDGGLNHCDHIGECESYGSIFGTETDKEKYNWWLEREKPIEECKACPLYPQCYRLAHCVDMKLKCTEITRNAAIGDIKKAMLNNLEFRMRNAE